MRRKILFLLLLLFAFTGTGCRHTGPIDSEQSLHVAALTGPLTMNPVFLRDAASAEVATLLHPQLLVTDPETLIPQPRLFTSWELQEDKLTYVFTLHEDARWSDGRHITAEDVAFTLRVI
ncbi:MAG: ABC transporter substrate-binding protein, partial [Firmicutes bacterium]|nr:ABC transporter substrate-binding protein [Bacillota bacterium]